MKPYSGNLFYVLGPKGTNASLAAFEYSELAMGNSNLRLVERGTNYAALAAFAAETAADAFAVAPIENSSEGAVGETLRFWRDQLLCAGGERLGFRVLDELRQPIRHCLARRPGGDFKTVISHPQALGQCSGYLFNLSTEPRSSTAAAAREAAEGDGTYAAVCSRFAAECYGLEVVDDDIQDDRWNETRFHVLGRFPTPTPTGEDRMSLIVELPNAPGAAHYASGMFGAHGVNVSMQQSVNLGLSGDGTNRYAHYFEAECHEDDPRGSRALTCLRTLALDGRMVILGSYPRAARPQEGGAR